MGILKKKVTVAAEPEIKIEGGDAKEMVDVSNKQKHPRKPEREEERTEYDRDGRPIPKKVVFKVPKKRTSPVYSRVAAMRRHLVSTRDEELLLLMHGTTADFRMSSTFIFTPHSYARLSWDMFMLSLVVLSSVQVPWMAAFDVEPGGLIRGFEFLLDMAFALDMVLSFRTGYYDRGVLVLNWRRIGRNYVRSLFVFDLIAVIPWSLFMKSKARRVIKLARLVRLLKLMSTIKLVKMNERWAKHLQLPALVVEVLKFGWIVAFVAHWMACGWFFTASFYDYDKTTWVARYYDSGRQVSSNPATDWGDGTTMADLKLRVNWYAVSLYYALTTMTTVGYGDITPYNDVERTMACAAMIVGGLFYAYVVGNVTLLVQDIDPKTKAIEDHIKVINAYMAEKNFPKELRFDIREHYTHIIESEHEDRDKEHVLSKLSTRLENEARTYLNVNTLRQCYVFKMVDSAFIQTYEIALDRHTFAAGQDMLREGTKGTSMYIIESGQCDVIEYNGNWVTSIQDGAVFGEMALLMGDFIRHATVRARTVCCVHRMKPSVLRAICDEWPLVEVFLSQVVKARKLHLLAGVPLPVETEEYLKSMYNVADTNQNGSIDYEEFYAILKSMNKKVTEVTLKRLVQLIDPESTGRVAWKEFKELMGMFSMDETFGAWRELADEDEDEDNVEKEQWWEEDEEEEPQDHYPVGRSKQTMFGIEQEVQVQYTPGDSPVGSPPVVRPSLHTSAENPASMPPSPQRTSSPRPTRPTYSAPKTELHRSAQWDDGHFDEGSEEPKHMPVFSNSQTKAVMKGDDVYAGEAEYTRPRHSALNQSTADVHSVMHSYEGGPMVGEDDSSPVKQRSRDVAGRLERSITSAKEQRRYHHKQATVEGGDEIVVGDSDEEYNQTDGQHDSTHDFLRHSSGGIGRPEVLKELRELRLHDVLMTLAELVGIQQELDAVTPALVNQISALRLDQVLKHLGEVEVMQQVLDKSVRQMKELKLRLLKSAAQEAKTQVTYTTHVREKRTATVKALVPGQILDDITVQRLTEPYHQKEKPKYQPEGGW